MEQRTLIGCWIHLGLLMPSLTLHSPFLLLAEAAEADDDSTPVRMQPSNDTTAILQDPNHTPVEGELDFEKDSDETLEAQAKWGAQQALLAAQQRTKTFDEESKEHQEQRPNIALNQTDCKRSARTQQRLRYLLSLLRAAFLTTLCSLFQWMR